MSKSIILTKGIIWIKNLVNKNVRIKIRKEKLIKRGDTVFLIHLEGTPALHWALPNAFEDRKYYYFLCTDELLGQNSSMICSGLYRQKLHNKETQSLTSEPAFPLKTYNNNNK